MTMVAMPAVKTSAMPVAAAGKDANVAVSTDAGAPAEGQFAAVLQRRSEAQDRSTTDKRADARGQQGHKDAKTTDSVEGAKAPTPAAPTPMAVNPATVVPFPAKSSSASSTGVEAAETSTRDTDGLPVDASGNAVAPQTSASTEGASGAELQGRASVGSGSDGDAGDTVLPGATVTPAGPEDGMERSAGQGTFFSTQRLKTPPPTETDHTELLQPVTDMTAGTAMAAGAAAAAAVAKVVPSAGPQSAATGRVQEKVSGAGRHSMAGSAALHALRQDGPAGLSAGVNAQGRPDEENGRGAHGGKSETRTAGRTTGEAVDLGGRGSAAAGEASSGAAQPVMATTLPVQGFAAAAPGEVPRALTATNASRAGEVSEAAGLGSAAAGSPGANVDAAVETAPLTSVGAARLLKTVAGSELRVGTQSADLGAVTIRTVLGREQMQAHVSFENERMGSALSAHLLGGSLEDRLGQSLGVRTSVTLSASTDAGTGQSGRDSARDAMGGGFSNQTGSESGNNRGASGRYGAQATPGSLGAHGNGAGGAGVNRSLPYGAAAAEGRLDIRI